MRISPRYYVADWESIAFSREEDWQKAIDIFRDRIESRYLRYVRQIEGDNNAGFVIMALDCLLIETLQQFYLGEMMTPPRKSRDHFISFLTQRGFGTHFTKETAERFYKDIRNGILHQAEVKGSSKIMVRRELPLVKQSDDKKGIIINRRLFHMQLLNEFEEYISRLKDPEETELRKNFRKKMNYICQLSQISWIEMHDRIYYFAYGSNMNPERMIERKIVHSQRKHAILKGFRLVFNKKSGRNPKEGFANIVVDKNGIVEGVLYEIAASDLSKLDRMEGYPIQYDRIELKVETDDGKNIEAEVYEAQPDYIKNGLKPSKNYMKHLLAVRNIISNQYYKSLETFETLD